MTERKRRANPDRAHSFKGVEFQCAYCGKSSVRRTGEVNRARKSGANLYCSKECSGMGRRIPMTDTERRAAKAEYDHEYRAKNRALLKAKKAAYYQRTKDPVREAAIRKKRMAAHVEYCRRPEYKEWKREYDRQYRAQKQYGEFADCFLLAQEIRQECLSQASDYEIRLSAGTLNKSTQRKRDYERSHGNRAEIGALGNVE